MPGDLRIAILGPLEVAGPRLRRLLLRLALDPGRVVTTGQLIDAVWDEDPPAGAANALQALVSRLRRLLPGAVESAPSGYRLAVAAEAVDAVRFDALAVAGREQLGRDPVRARALLGEALDLWRGPALAEVATSRSPARPWPGSRTCACGPWRTGSRPTWPPGPATGWWPSWRSWWPPTRCRSGSAASCCAPWPCGAGRPTPSRLTSGCGPGWPRSSASTRPLRSRRSTWPCSAASWSRRSPPPRGGRPTPTCAPRSPASSAAATT